MKTPTSLYHTQGFAAAGLAALLLGLFVALPVSAGDFDDSKAQHIEKPAWFKQNPFYELDADLDEARQAGKQGLMVMFTTVGCSYCDIFVRKSLGDPEIAGRVQKNFDSVGLEIFDDANMVTPEGKDMPIKDFSNREGVQYSPSVLFYGENGQRLLRVVGYQSPERFKKILDYMEGKHYLKISLKDYMQQHARKPAAGKPVARLADDPIFAKPPFILQRNVIPASQPMMVLFEKRGCEECESFHENVLSLEEVREALGKFEVVRLDANDDKTVVLGPDGKRTTPAQWYQNTEFSRLPALVFFDEKGNVVQKTDALVLRQRMMNTVNFVLERAYEKNWTYQRFARSKAIERNLKKAKTGASNNGI